MFPFWILVLGVVAFLAIVIALVLDSEGTATFISIVALGIVGWFMWPSVSEFFAQPNAWLTLTLWIAGYLGVGVAFSFVKWVFYSRKAAAAFAKWRAENPERSTSDYYSDYRAIIIKTVEGVATFTVDQAKLTGRVLSWTSYWPAHVVVLVFDDLIKNIVDVVVRLTRKVFQGITNWAFAGLK